MMGLPISLSDSRLASSIKQIAAGAGGAGGRLLALGSLAAVLSSTVSSILAYASLPGQIRIHWTLGMGPYYGPEFAPKALVLTAFPALVAGVALGAYWLDTRLRHDEEFATARPYYALAMLGTLGVLLAAHVALIAVNLP